MVSRIKNSYVLNLFAAVLGFGIFMGLVFPPVVSPFVEWKSTSMHIWFAVLSIVAGIAVGVVCILLVKIFLLKRIRLVGAQLKALSEGQGHVTSRINFTSDDDLGRLIENFNLLLGKLGASMGQIRDGAEEISAHSSSTRDLSQLLAEGSEEKTQLIVDTAISIDELDSSFQTVVGNLEELQASSDESRVAVQSQVAQIEKVNEQVALLLEQCQANTEGVKAAGAASHRTVQHSQELTAALTEAAASMTQMDHTIREIDRNLKETSAIAEKVMLDAGVGKEATWKTQKGMNKIRESFETASNAIRLFSDKVKEIAAITEVIDEVTDQTNLLALNAAIIAAQAGEHGRGFAVVADQIKKLADQTSSSTREIGSLIRGFQEQAYTAISSTGEIQGYIEEGVSLSQQAGGSLDNILENASNSHSQVQTLENAIKEISTTSHYLSERVDSIAGKARSISDANRDQEASLATVNETVLDTRNVAGTLSESAREQLASSKKIREQTETVNRLISVMQQSIGAGEKGAQELLSAIQKMQQLSHREGDRISTFDKESDRLLGLYQNLREEIAKLSPPPLKTATDGQG
jgi:methyl-accepting chemotaxis protein